MAVEVLKSRGVPEERILFLNLIASPEGVQNFATKFPKLRVVTAFIDQVRNLVCSPKFIPLQILIRIPCRALTRRSMSTKLCYGSLH